MNTHNIECRAHFFFRKSRNYLKILGAPKMTWSKFNVEDTEKIRYHRTAIWCAGFVHRWMSVCSKTVR